LKTSKKPPYGRFFGLFWNGIEKSLFDFDVSCQTRRNKDETKTSIGKNELYSAIFDV